MNMHKPEFEGPICGLEIIRLKDILKQPENERWETYLNSRPPSFDGAQIAIVLGNHIPVLFEHYQNDFMRRLRWVIAGLRLFNSLDVSARRVINIAEMNHDSCDTPMGMTPKEYIESVDAARQALELFDPAFHEDILHDIFKFYTTIVMYPVLSREE